MPYLSTEKFNNNEQVSKVFLGRILAETCLKMDYFGSKSPSESRLDLMND